MKREPQYSSDGEGMNAVSVHAVRNVANNNTVSDPVAWITISIGG